MEQAITPRRRARPYTREIPPMTVEGTCRVCGRTFSFEQYPGNPVPTCSLNCREADARMRAAERKRASRARKARS